jgi:hypothetical protein
LESVAAIYQPSVPSGALRQGEILTNLVQVCLQPDTLFSGAPVLDPMIHPFAIVMSQDCDLDQDFKARQGQGSDEKKLPNVLFCEVITAEQLRGFEGINSTIWARVKINKDERYQFLQRVASAEDSLGEGLPELGIDFKRCFTLPTNEVYLRIEVDTNRRCRLVSPFLEHFCARFAHYLCRVALPQEHFSEPT